MNATTDDRSPADLEREGEQIRASLDRTLDEIQHRFSAGELMDRSMEFLRDNGMEMVREAGETVRRNPVPVLLTAAGLVWLTTSVARSRSGRRQAGDGRDISPQGRSQYRTQSSGSYASHGDYQDANQDDWDNSAHGRVRNATHRVKNRVSDRLSSSMQAVQGHTQNASSHFTSLVQEQPVALGALALAAGALLGAALPMTQAENRWVGPVHDRTMARAKEVGQREYENIREAVTSRARGERGSSESRGSTESTRAGAGNGSSGATGV